MSAKHCKRPVFKNSNDARGFTLIELTIVVAIAFIATAMAIPGFSSINRYLRIAGDMHDLNGTIALAKMRAAQDFTHARVYADLANNTFHLEVWNKTGGAGGTGCWKTDGDVVNACTVASISPVQNLSVGVTFGFGGASAGGPNPQNPIAQATSCYTGVAITGLAGGATGNTACIEFNSRGIPVDPSNGGAPTANDALYVTDGNTVYGATVNAGGFIQDWETPTSATSWAPR